MSRAVSASALFGGLLVFWLVLSGQWDPLFIGMGVVAAAVVTYLTHGLVAAGMRGGGVPLRMVPLCLLRYVRYLLWLLGRMVVASVQIAWFVLHPRLPADPTVVRIPTTLKSRPARAIVANSITLIPGTLTIDLRDDEYVVHAFVPRSADDLISGVLQSRVGAIFLEEPQGPVVPTWDPPRRLDA
jgi:multicomponent Na+:H+ antiporter subunit E